MKKSILLIITFFTVFAVSGQVRVGFRSHFWGMQAIHNVTEYYNKNRPWLDNEMGTGTSMNGFEIGIGGARKNYGYSFLNIHYVWTNRKASGTTPTGEDFTRKVHLSQVGVDWVDAWWTPLHIKRFNFGFGIMPAGTATINMSTRYNGEKTKIATSHNTGSDYFLGIPLGHIYHVPHIDVTYLGDKGAGLHLQLFYTIGPSQEYDLAYLNREINPKSYNAINKRTLLEVNNFGLKLMCNF